MGKKLKYSFYSSVENKILRNKFVRRQIRPLSWKVQNVADRNLKSKSMESYTMFKEGKTQYC